MVRGKETKQGGYLEENLRSTTTRTEPPPSRGRREQGGRAGIGNNPLGGTQHPLTAWCRWRPAHR